MSISTEISRIKAAKESLKSAINARGGSLSNELLDDYAAAVTALPTGGSDIDLSGVTVTADKLLAGVVAVDGSGSKVTGTIPEVTASKSGKTVTVPAGHHAKKQEFTFEEAPINLSFITATASDILTGKVGADKNGNPVTGALVIPSVPEAPDLSVVTVTADTMLKGKVAVNSAGQKITGTIETVTASWRSEGLVIVPVGYVAEAQTVTIPVMSEVSFVGDSVLIPSGYNKDSHRVPMPKGEVTVTDNQIWISPGYIENKIITVPEAEALTVSGNKVTVPVGYIKVERTAEIPVVSATLTDNKVTIPAGYNNGQTLTVAEAPAPSVSGNVVTFGKGYNATEKKVTVGTARESTTITPGTSWKQIPADTYCIGAQYIAGDENLVPENIAEGVSIFNVQGTHKGGGGGGGEFYKCAAVYGPYDVETVVISGCPVADANGEYLPTDQTTTSWDGQTYPVYANGKGWYYGYSEYGGNGITQDFNNGLTYSGEVGNGTWYDNMEYMPVEGMTGVKGSATLDTDVPKTWDGCKAVMSNGVYTFENTVTTGLTYSDIKPQKNCIYSADCMIKTDWLIQDYPTYGLIFYAPLTENLVAETGQSITAQGACSVSSNGALFEGYNYLSVDMLNSIVPWGNVDYTVCLQFTPAEVKECSILAIGFSGGLFEPQIRNSGILALDGVADDDPIMTMEAEKCYTVFFVKHGNGIRVYSDTNLIHTYANSGRWTTIKHTDAYPVFYIGCRYNKASNFSGTIRNVMVYNRALSEAEISQLVDKFSPTA